MIFPPEGITIAVRNEEFFAIKTESPNVNPVIIVIKKFMGVVVAPIAANEISPSTFPTIKASAQL